MIAYTTLLLFLVGVIGCIRIGVKFDKLLSFFLLTALCAIFAHFVDNIISNTEHIFSFTWNSSPSGDIKVDIISNAYNYNLIFPFFVITLAIALLNQVFRYEEHLSRYNAALCFNLATLIVMITSNNFVQLLSAVFTIDILALFMIRNWEAYRRFALMNFAADMMLFAILAMINCKIDSLDLRQILMYKQSGFHVNEITLLGLTAVFIKTGFFLFHLSLADLRNIRLHRLQSILFLSSPISALILLLKFHVLWQASPYFAPYLNTECALTIGLGSWGFFSRDNIKSKFISLQTMFWAIFIILLSFNGFIWNKQMSILLLLSFTIFCCLYLIYFYIHRPQSMSLFFERRIENKKAVALTFSMMLLTIAGMSGILADIYNNSNRYYIWSFGILFILPLSIFCRHTLWISPLKPSKSNETIKILPFLLVSLLTAISFQYVDFSRPIFWLFPFIFLIICGIPEKTPLKPHRRLPQKDLVDNFYTYVLIKPIKLCGKVLWLWVDRMLVEKLFLGLVIALSKNCLYCFRRVHSNGFVGAIIVIIFISFLLWASFLNGEIGNV